jgi:poly-gamma-glutamate synthesis protein (capsule biosynthesis protein)
MHRARLLFVFLIFAFLSPACWGQDFRDFKIGDYHALALMGDSGLDNETLYISFAGDFGFSGKVPSEDVLQRHLDLEADLLSRFGLNVINMETLLPGVSGNERDRQVDSVVMRLLSKAGYEVVGTANNHSVDRGTQGVRYTSRVLKEAGFSVIGSRDFPVYKWESAGQRVFIYAMTDALDIPDRDGIVMTTSEADLAFMNQQTTTEGFKIAFVHLGSMSSFPSPHEREIAQRLLDRGADLIVCTGSHFVKGFASEGGRPVAYGIGNHLFETEWHAEPIGMHLVVGVKAGKAVQVLAIPFRNTSLSGSVGPLDDTEFHEFKKVLVQRSTTDTSLYYSDSRSLETLKDQIQQLSWTRLMELKPRHLVYTARVAFNHYPLATVLGALGVLGLPAFVISMVIFRRRKSKGPERRKPRRDETVSATSFDR